MLTEWIWRLIARFLARPRVAAWIIARAQRTPYLNIHGKDGTLYMARWWLFNRYDRRPRAWWRDRLPSMRVHRIMREDSDRHLHDHPWDARTIILRGWYIEQREKCYWRTTRTPGETATLKFGEFHRITNVPTDGVYTLFITWRYRGTWGFKVGDEKVPYDVYLKEHDR